MFFLKYSTACKGCCHLRIPRDREIDVLNSVILVTFKSFFNIFLISSDVLLLYDRDILKVLSYTEKKDVADILND